MPCHFISILYIARPAYTLRPLYIMHAMPFISMLYIACTAYTAACRLYIALYIMHGSAMPFYIQVIYCLPSLYITSTHTVYIVSILYIALPLYIMCIYILFAHLYTRAGFHVSLIYRYYMLLA